jgi:hypothetical protein
MAFWTLFIVWFWLPASALATSLLVSRNSSSSKMPASPSLDERKGKGDAESGSVTPDTVAKKRQHKAESAQGAHPRSRPGFSWYHMNYDVTVAKGKQRRPSDDASGFVAPGKMVSVANNEVYARLMFILKTTVVVALKRLVSQRHARLINILICSTYRQPSSTLLRNVLAPVLLLATASLTAIPFPMALLLGPDIASRWTFIW